MYTDLSVDLETLGTATGSVITQVGLAFFNRRVTSGGTATKSGRQFAVDPQSALDTGFTIDWSTISWWLQQAEAPRVQMARQKGEHIEVVLRRVVSTVCELSDPARVCVWGNGASFDIGLLDHAYRKLDIKAPWHFRNVRDLRTLADISTPNEVLRPTPDTEHNALDDAMAQAEWIQRLTRAIETREVHCIVEQPQGDRHNWMG